ncbi:SRPBCC family protein [Limnobacter sp.]|uniref:SRPBCC family protein n=1 Tax=Limnobacter sp. TaxID=2003368 RepID=UPI0035163461
MKFEHLVQINDPSLPGVDWLTREQLWLGLVARAWKPTKFIMGLEDAQVLETSRDGNVTTLTRKLNYGAFQIEDTIELFEEERTETRIKANQHCGNSTLTITIEEPKTGELWLRFEYHVRDPEPHAADPLSNHAKAHEYEEIRKQAYRAADIDTVRMIRELALSLPGTPPGARKDH